MQICMDSSDWLKGIATDDAAGTNASSPLSADLTPTPRQFNTTPLPPTDRRLRPHHDHPLKCPRCDSSHTKFCYYNNYSLSQPRYFCKTCRRYWTKGGSLRNVPVGGGCRKSNKRTTNPNCKKQSAVVAAAATQLHLSTNPNNYNIFPEWKHGYGYNYNGLGLNYNHENKFLSGAEGGELGIGAMSNALDLSGLHALHALRFSIGNVPGQEMEVPVQQGISISLPFLGHDDHEETNNEVDVKPAAAAARTLLPVEWHETTFCCADSNREGIIGYANETALWGPVIRNQ